MWGAYNWGGRICEGIITEGRICGGLITEGRICEGLITGGTYMWRGAQHKLLAYLK